MHAIMVNVRVFNRNISQSLMKNIYFLFRPLMKDKFILLQRIIIYELMIDYFILSPVAWWDNFYIPLEKRLSMLRKKYLENDQALELIEFVQLEIDLYRKYPEYYGYVFYIMQKS